MDNNENVTNEVVEEKKAPKKNNTPMLVIGLAVLLIVAGIVLIVTGNNKSFLAKDKDENVPQEDGNREVTPVELKVDNAIELIEKEKIKANEDWTLGNLEIIARGNNNTFLVKYDKEYDTNLETVQTIITYDGENWTVEFPGWPEGSVDLTSYNFVYNNEEPIEDPTEQPVEEPTEQPTVEEPTEQPAVEEPAVQPAVEEQPVENNEATE